MFAPAVGAAVAVVVVHVFVSHFILFYTFCCFITQFHFKGNHSWFFAITFSIPDRNNIFLASLAPLLFVARTLPLLPNPFSSFFLQLPLLYPLQDLRERTTSPRPPPLHATPANTPPNLVRGRQPCAPPLPPAAPPTRAAWPGLL